jgi:hypothetical protein
MTTYTGPSVTMTIAPPTSRQNKTTIISLPPDWEDQPTNDETNHATVDMSITPS